MSCDITMGGVHRQGAVQPLLSLVPAQFAGVTRRTAPPILQLDGVGIGLEIVPLRLLVRAALGGDDGIRAAVGNPHHRVPPELAAQRHGARLCGRPRTPAAGYSGARTGVSWCSDSPRKNGFCSLRRAIKNMIGRPRTIEPMPSRNTLPISTLVPGTVQPPR